MIEMRVEPEERLPNSTLRDEGPKRLLFVADVVLVAFCALSTIVAAIAWARGDADAAPVLAIGALLVVNLAASRHPARWRDPLRVEIVRAAFGAVLAPAAYLVSTKPFGHWWPGFLLMCLTGSVTVGVLSGSPRASRILVTYYMVLFAASVAIAGDVTLARAIVVGGGMVIAGVPEPRPDHAVALCEFGLRMQEFVKGRTFHGRSLRFRVGINSGPVFPASSARSGSCMTCGATR